MGRLFLHLLPVALNFSLCAMCFDRDPDPVPFLCRDENSIEIHVSSAADFQEQLKSGKLRLFLERKFDQIAGPPDASCLSESADSASTNPSSKVTVSTNSMDSSSTQQPTVVTGSPESDRMTTTEQRVSTSEETTDSMSTTKTDAMTSPHLGTTIDTTTDATNSFTTDDERSPMPTCPTAEHDGDCELIYYKKCFTWVKDPQIYTLAVANDTCFKKGFQLGNIYDDCHYNQIMKKLENQYGGESFDIRTGMTIDFVSGNENVYLSSGNKTKVENSWWFPGYPQRGMNDRYISISVKGLPIPGVPMKKGIKNEADDKSDGAFCEKGT